MSKEIIHNSRHGCALHGVLKTLEAVSGIVPLVHSTAGCSIFSHLSGGLAGRGYMETPSTAVFEKQIVFGGTARLREQIKNGVKVLAGDLYVVVTGCAPEIVGDDTPAMVKEAREQGFPVISVSAPGFKGSGYRGHEWALRALVEHVAQPSEKDGRLVNVLGIVPGQDLLWEGNLRAMEGLLAGAGLESNALFGFGASVGNWRRAAAAALNVVVSPWGVPAARRLEEKFGTPFVYWGYLPTGEKDTGALLEKIGECLSLPAGLFDGIFLRERRRLDYHLRRLAQPYIRFGFQREVALVGETSLVLGVSRFLQEDFGQRVVLVVVTDCPDEAFRGEILAALNEHCPVPVIFTSDGKEIDAQLRIARPGLILGSGLERRVAGELSAPLLRVSAPVVDRTFLEYTYGGYSGAVNLLQDFSGIVLADENI